MAVSTEWNRLQVMHRDYCKDLDEALAARSVVDQELRRYADESRDSIRRVLDDPYELLTKDSFLERVTAELDVLYVGDFHPDPRPKELLLEITRQARKRGRKVFWVLEAVPVSAMVEEGGETVSLSGEEIMREYFDDGDQTKFFNRLSLEASLGADNVNYVNLFETARDERIRIVPAGVSRDEEITTITRKGGETARKTKTKKTSIYHTDEEVAKLVSYVKSTDPTALVCVFDGDHHVTPNHLPSKVDVAVKNWTNQTLKSAIVLSTDEAVYREISKKEANGERNIVSLGNSSVYVVVNTTPLERKLSTIFDRNVDQEREDFDENISALVEVIAKYLKMDSPGEVGEVFLGVDRKKDFLKRKIPGKATVMEDGLRSRRLARSKHTILPDGSMYVEHVRVRDIAELLGIYMHYRHLKSTGQTQNGIDSEDFFYYNILRNAMGYFASKIVNPTRRYRGMSDYRGVIESIASGIREKLEEERKIFQAGLKDGKPVTVAVKTEEAATTLRPMTNRELWSEIKKIDEKLGLKDRELAATGKKTGGYRHDNKVWRQAEIAISFDDTCNLPEIPQIPESIKGVPEDISVDEIVIDEDQVIGKIPQEKRTDEIVSRAIKRAKERRKEQIESERRRWEYENKKANDERDDLAETLGYQLGHKLFSGVMQGDIAIQFVRDSLFKTTHDPGKTKETYDLLRAASDKFGNEKYDDYL